MSGMDWVVVTGLMAAGVVGTVVHERGWPLAVACLASSLVMLRALGSPL